MNGSHLGKLGTINDTAFVKRWQMETMQCLCQCTSKEPLTTFKKRDDIPIYFKYIILVGCMKDRIKREKQGAETPLKRL